MDRVEEKRLIRHAQNGHKEAFAQLYQEHVQTIYRYIYYRVGDKQLAEDLTGDVFVKALIALPKYREQGRPFIAWLYRIAHARVIDFYRLRERRPDESNVEAEPIIVTSNMDTALLQQQTAKALQMAIAELTDEQQQVIILRFIEGQSLENVAGIMGKNTNAIKALQYRALRALASKLERSGFDVENILAGLS